MKLKKVGFFRELRHGMPDGPELRSLLSPSPYEHEDRIAQYLRNGVLLIASPGVIEDVLSPGQLIGGPHILTDGVWAWPSDLAHYVEKYHVRLPSEFTDHMAQRNWAVPPEDSFRLDLLSL